MGLVSSVAGRGGPRGLSPPRWLAVEATARELWYTPNRAARSLVTGHSDSTVLSGHPMARSEQVYCADVDNVGGARLATRHLLDAGRRLVATVAGPQDMGAGRDRLQGYADELGELGLPMRTDLVAEGDLTMATGDRAMSRLLATEPAVDAVFAASDLMTLGVMHARGRSGRRIPDDVAVVGSDDIPEAARDAGPHDCPAAEPRDRRDHGPRARGADRRPGRSAGDHPAGRAGAAP